MTTDWNDVYLKDCLILGNGKTRPLSQGDIPVFGGNGILDYCDSYNYSGGTIIIGRVGAYCGSTYISNDKIWVSDNALSAKPIKNNDIKFLYYNLLNIGLNQFAEGSSHPLLTHSLLYSLKILLPPIPEQRAIAAVLSNLDDKIDLLQRQNATLEAMAEVLFKQWFVVEAKEDWEEKTLGDFFPITTGKKNSNYSTDDGKFPFFTCSKKVLLAPNYSFDGAAILLSGNGYFDVKRYNGKFEAYQRTYVLIPDDTRFYNFLYIAIKMFLNNITQDYRGSVINFITKGMIENFPLLMPRENIDKKLQQIDIIFSRIDANVSQIRTLEKLRDTLLPKLMSGEVRVSLD